MMLYEILPSYLAIDIGGTYIKSAIFVEKQNMYDHHQMQTKKIEIMQLLINLNT